MGEFFRFKVQLVGAKPPVFRRFLLHTKATFHDLHEAIQDSCGWTNSHLFAFRPPKKGDAIAGIPDDEGFGPPDPDAKKVPLTKWFSLTGNKTCVYEYDFGDGWQHEVKLETIEQHDGKAKRSLLDGARSFPPEDCGGIPGYEDCVQIASGGATDDPEHTAELTTWLGDWNPEAFNMVLTKGMFDR